MSFAAWRPSPRVSAAASAAIALSFLAVALTSTVPTARAVFRDATLKPPQFDPFVYVPGETLQWTIRAAAGDRFDVEIVIDPDFDPLTKGTDIARWNDRPVPPSGQLNMNYTILATQEDGPWYWVRVYDSSWIENGRNGVTFFSQRFVIQGYRFSIETDRGAYLPGDAVTVTWSANMVRDGSLAPGGAGKIWAYDDAGGQLIAPEPYLFTASTGSFRLTLNTNANPAVDARAWGWFNDTPSNPNRHQSALAVFQVNQLGLRVTTSAATYQPGSVVTVTVVAKIATVPANPSPSDPGAERVAVNLTVTDLSTGALVPAYGPAAVLFTDAHGTATHVFQLGLGIADGTQFEVAADAAAHGGGAPALVASGRAQFTVRTVAGISVQLTQDKAQYTSGDTVALHAEPYGNTTGSVTFVWEARDVTLGAGNALLDRKTGLARDYRYNTTTTFEGSIRFQVTVDDGRGNRAVASTTLQVAVGWLVVTADRSEYTPGATVTVSWSLLSNVIRNPAYFHEITDAGGLVVRSGPAAGTSVAYSVPTVPSSSYTFTISASEAGRVVTGRATVSAVSGFILSLSLDRPSYLPGETVRIGYAIERRGLSVLPLVFTFQVALAGAPPRTQQTTSASGTLTYVIPQGVSRGNLLLVVTESSTNTLAIQTLTVGTTNPLWSTTVADIPLFDILLGLLLLIVIVLFVRRYLPFGRGGPQAPGAAPRPAAPAPPTAAPGPSPMNVACKACGASIEVTTSKRPIEVMCPNCGETQMVT